MSLKYRLFALLLGAPLLLMLIYAGYMLLQDSQQRRHALEERLRENSELLAGPLVDALNRGERDRLENLAQRLLDVYEVRAVAIRDVTGEPLLQVGSTSLALTPPLPGRTRFVDHGGQWRLLKPLPVSVPMGDTRGELGSRYWLDLTVSDTGLELSIYRQIANHALAWLIMALLFIALAYAIQRRIFPTLAAQQEALARLDSGDYTYRVHAQGPRELAPLTRAINSLGEHLQHARDDMRQQIEQTTADLQESMETIEIQNIELDMARRRAQEANRIKSEFLANMSHEIRTPLNGIVGFCRLLGRSHLDSRQREWLEHIENASDNLLSLINDILDFSKIEAGKLELETVPLDMLTLVDEVLALQAPPAQQKGLHLLGLVYDDVPTELLGDPLRIKQVLANLVNNAIKFTERGEVIVRVLVEEIEGNTTLLQVKVCDTGIGLSPEIQQQLFQPFNQGVVSRSRQYGGSGLGLMICRQLVEKMGGSIHVSARPQPGSEFTVTLPLRSLAAPSERPAEIALDNPLIALYEPHDTTCQALQHLFERWGARVQVLDDFRINALPEPDLLVISLTQADLQPEALASWNDALAAVKCPVLVLANAPYELEELALPAASETLCKPVARARLAETFERLLAVTGTPRADAAPASLREEAPLTPGQARVLVVDDVPSNRLLVKELLSQTGVDVLLATSGEEALALAHEETVDLVLMDIRMPGMSGIEAMQALRRLGGRWASCPFVALTAHAQAEETRQLLNDGMQEVLTKPLDERSLASLLRRCLGIATPFVPPREPAETPPDEQTLPVVDLELGRRMAGGRHDLAREILDMLLDSLDASETALRQAYASGNEDAFLDAVHYLNGACRYSSVPQLALRCETLETRLHTHGMACAGSLLEAVFDAMQHLREWQKQQTEQG